MGPQIDNYDHLIVLTFGLVLADGKTFRFTPTAPSPCDSHASKKAQHQGYHNPFLGKKHSFLGKCMSFCIPACYGFRDYMDKGA